jgi:hypothetical protein
MTGTTKEIQGVIPWNGKGNYTQNADVTLAGKTGSGSVTGTYTVDSNGRFSSLDKGFVAALRQAFLNRQLCLLHREQQLCPSWENQSCTRTNLQAGDWLPLAVSP